MESLPPTDPPLPALPGAAAPAGLRGRRAGLLLVLLIALAVHAVGLRGEFLFDDNRFVKDNTALATLSDPLRFFTDIRTADPKNTNDIYRPLRTLSFAVERAAFGEESAAGYHGVSVLLHAANAALVYLLLIQLGFGPAATAFGGAVFAAHPGTVEATAWISARADLMAAFFTLAGVHGWVRSRGFDRWYALAMAGVVLACLSKEAAIVIPGFFVVADLARPGGGPAAARARWRMLLPPAAFCLGYALLARAMIEGAKGGVLGHLPGWWGGSYGAELALAARAGAYQALFAAAPLVPQVDWYMPMSRTLLEPGALAAGVFLLVLAGAAVRLILGGGEGTAGRTRGGTVAGAGVLWALLGGLVTSQVLLPIGIPTAERFLYLSLAGAVFAAAAGYERAAAAGPRAAAALGVAAVAGLGLISADRTGVWRSEAVLWRDGPAGVFSPRAESWRISLKNHGAAAQLNLADTALRRGDTGDAQVLLRSARATLEEAVREAVALRAWWGRAAGWPVDDPNEVKARRNLGRVLLRQKDPAGALREAEAARKLDPADARGIDLEAVALCELGRLQKAGWRLEEAVAAAKKEGGVAWRPGEAGIPPDDVAGVLNPVARWRLTRGLDGAALRALRLSAEALPDPARNPAVAQAPDLAEKIRARRRDLEEAARMHPGDAAAAAASLAYVGRGGGEKEETRDLFRRLFPDEAAAAWPRTLWAIAVLEADDMEAGWRSAEAWHRGTLALFPGDTGALLGLARCLESLEDRPGAEAAWRQVLDDPRTSPDALREAKDGMARKGR